MLDLLPALVAPNTIFTRFRGRKTLNGSAKSFEMAKG